MPDAPYAVSLVNSKCEVATHSLRVMNTGVKEHPLLNHTVCVSPLHHDYDNSQQLVETIEMNRILGANRLVFYNFSSGQSVTRLINYYSSIGVADVIQWQLPVSVDTNSPNPDIIPDIHYFGQLVALNDCLYRYMFQSRFIIFTDLDELIIPRQTLTWESMRQQISCPSNTGVFVFSCTFFRTDWDDSNITGSNDKIKALQLNTLLKLRRERKIYPPMS